MAGVKAHLVKGVRKAIVSDDKKYGLLGFERERPDGNGSDEIWIGIPVHNLPMFAVAAIRAIPQPQSPTGKHPAVFSAEVVQFGLGPFGELTLTVEFQKGAALSLKLEEHQARKLAKGIQEALTQAKVEQLPSTRPH